MASISGSGRAAQGPHDGFHGKAADGGDRFHREYRPCLFVGKVFNGLFHQLRSHSLGVIRMEFPVLHARESGLVAGADHLGVVAGRHRSQGGHDALVVHDHHLHRAGGQNQFGHQVVSGHGNPVPHEQFVSGAADAGKVDPVGALGFGQVEHFRGFTRLQDHFRNHGIVAVNNDVDLVFLQDSRIHHGGFGTGNPEKDVRYLRGNHGTSPAVGQGVAQRLQQEALPVIVHAHVGAVHHFRGFPVNAPRRDADLVPELPALFRGPLEQGYLLLAHAVIFHHGPGQFPGQGQGILSLRVDTIFHGHPSKLSLIPDAVARRLPLGHAGQHLHQIPAVVGMG